MARKLPERQTVVEHAERPGAPPPVPPAPGKGQPPSLTSQTVIEQRPAKRGR